MLARMSTYCVIGTGLLATALKNKLGDYSWYPTDDTEVIFYFGGVRHMDFEKNVKYHRDKEWLEFCHLFSYCEEYSIKLIYASSALVYEKDTDFTKHKKAMEKLTKTSKNALGLRIFPVYGVGSHTVISEWCKAVKENTAPIIWGNGTQKRDFIYTDDFVDQVLGSLDKVGICDIGTGIGTSFNEIVETINTVLGKDIKPVYAPSPPDYSQGIYCKNPLSTKVSLEEGIKKICKA